MIDKLRKFWYYLGAGGMALSSWSAAEKLWDSYPLLTITVVLGMLIAAVTMIQIGMGVK